MERESQPQSQFNHEALNRHYAVMAVDPYALGMDSEGPNKGKERLSELSHWISHEAGRLVKAGLVDRVVFFEDPSFGPNFQSTGDLMAKHLVERDGFPQDKVKVIKGKDQNQTAPQVDELAKYLKDLGLPQDTPVLYPMWDYHRERVQNHAAGFGVNVVPAPMEEVYGELNPGYNFGERVVNGRLRFVLPEAEKMESLRRKVSRYDKRGFIPRRAKRFLGGSFMIDTERRADGNLHFEYKKGSQKLEEISGAREIDNLDDFSNAMEVLKPVEIVVEPQGRYVSQLKRKLLFELPDMELSTRYSAETALGEVRFKDIHAVLKGGRPDYVYAYNTYTPVSREDLDRIEREYLEALLKRVEELKEKLPSTKITINDANLSAEGRRKLSKKKRVNL